jgi:3-oxoacyl-[acyl-carrier-protein] synthase II
MIAEILYHKHITDWELNKLLNNEQFANYVEPDYPLIIASYSGLGSETKCQTDFFVNKKRRARPSDLRLISQDSLVSHVAKTFSLNSEVIRVQAECVSSLYALNMASIISQAKNKPVVVFCADNLLADDFDMWVLNSFGAVDQSTGRPFDNTSKGFRMGVGASLMLVKHPSVTHTLPTIATISNFKFYTDPNLITNPGNVETIISRLGEIDYKKFDMWNAHATGTPVGDKVEYELFNKTINRDIPIISYKSYAGHCMAGAGAVEISMMLDDYASGTLRPNQILGERIVPDDRIITEPTSFTYRKILKAGLGFGGKTVVCEINLQ